jgi:biopolymer transport protein ExbD
MAGGDVAAEPRKHGKAKKRKKGRRVGIRIDMTPLVDVAFLLLTFFMLTTSMSRPQTMEINLPPDKTVKVEMAEHNLLTIRVNDKGGIFWNIALDAPQKIDFKDLHKFLVDKVAENPKLTILLKIDRQGKYNMMVNMIDEFNVAKISRFSIGPMMDADKALMAKVQA